MKWRRVTSAGSCPLTMPRHGAQAIIRLTLRSLLVAAHLLLGLLISLLIDVLAALGPPRGRIVQWWHRQLCRCLRVKIHVHGTRPKSAVMLVSNHVSWLDIPVLGALVTTRFVSKSEVAAWPVIGRLARASGTEFHRRGGGANGTRRLITRLTGHLDNGQTITVFPEGTTTLGATTRRFQPRLFAAAVESGRSVVPVLLRYGPDPETATITPYVGDDMFVPHLLRMLQRPRIVVDVWFLDSLSSEGSDRTTLARQAQHAIDMQLAKSPPELLPEREPALPRHRLPI